MVVCPDFPQRNFNSAGGGRGAQQRCKCALILLLLNFSTAISSLSYKSATGVALFGPRYKVSRRSTEVGEVEILQQRDGAICDPWHYLSFPNLDRSNLCETADDSRVRRKWSVSLWEIMKKKFILHGCPIQHMGDEGADEIVPSFQFPHFEIPRSSPPYVPWDRLTCSYIRDCGRVTHTSITERRHTGYSM